LGSIEEDLFCAKRLFRRKLLNYFYKLKVTKIARDLGFDHAKPQ